MRPLRTVRYVLVVLLYLGKNYYSEYVSAHWPNTYYCADRTKYLKTKAIYIVFITHHPSTTVRTAIGTVRTSQ